jgi:hypothetical protein
LSKTSVSAASACSSAPGLPDLRQGGRDEGGGRPQGLGDAWAERRGAGRDGDDAHEPPGRHERKREHPHETRGRQPALDPGVADVERPLPPQLRLHVVEPRQLGPRHGITERQVQHPGRGVGGVEPHGLLVQGGEETKVDVEIEGDALRGMGEGGARRARTAEHVAQVLQQVRRAEVLFPKTHDHGGRVRQHGAESQRGLPGERRVRRLRLEPRTDPCGHAQRGQQELSRGLVAIGRGRHVTRGAGFVERAAVENAAHDRRRARRQRDAAVEPHGRVDAADLGERLRPELEEFAIARVDDPEEGVDWIFQGPLSPNGTGNRRARC